MVVKLENALSLAVTQMYFYDRDDSKHRHAKLVASDQASQTSALFEYYLLQRATRIIDGIDFTRVSVNVTCEKFKIARDLLVDMAC